MAIRFALINILSLGQASGGLWVGDDVERAVGRACDQHPSAAAGLQAAYLVLVPPHLHLPFQAEEAQLPDEQLPLRVQVGLNNQKQYEAFGGVRCFEDA